MVRIIVIFRERGSVWVDWIGQGWSGSGDLGPGSAGSWVHVWNRIRGTRIRVSGSGDRLKESG